MRTKLLFNIFMLCLGLSLNAQYTLIPDSNFEQYLIDQGIDSEASLDGQILTSDASSPVILSMNSLGISDLTGIEDFSSLVFLICVDNNLTQIDVSDLTNLETLRLNSNELTSVDVSNNPLLRTFYAGNNEISAIDLSSNPLLENLILSQNPLTQVDLSNNLLLEDVRIEWASLTSIDVSALTELNNLVLSYNELDAIDISACTKLEDLFVRSNNLTEIDFSSSLELDRIFIDGNEISSVDVSMLDHLDYFICYDNLLTELDLSHNSVLRTMNCGSNLLEFLDIRTGNNLNMNACEGANNPFLNCVNVDDPAYSDSSWTYWDQGVLFSTDCSQEVLCPAFQTAPVDLTKSFDPVGGVRDRVQLKWYKASPQVRYSDEDAAMCDIKFWKKKDLDPLTGQPIGSAYVSPDTTLLDNKYKTYPDNSPREIFKWPVKYRADGVNNGNRVEPNIRYEWQVRCECGHDGLGQESPWSDIKIFNTPNFDPVTGIYTEPSANSELSSKTIETSKLNFQIVPNPSFGSVVTLQFENLLESELTISVVDITGRTLFNEQVNKPKDRVIELSAAEKLGAGMYLIQTEQANVLLTKQLLVR